MSSVGFVIIDLQYDFAFPGAPKLEDGSGGIPAGALYVPGGEATVPLINELRVRLRAAGSSATFLTQDWHPSSHVSFFSNNAGAAPFELRDVDGPDGPTPQVMWPPHCVQESSGADFIAGLDRVESDVIIRKGANVRVDSYSGFGCAAQGRHERTALEGALRARDIDALVIVGLATDYCVSYTARDAARLGFRVLVYTPACRGIAVDSIAAEEQKMAAAGVVLARSLEDVDAFVAAGRGPAAAAAHAE
jgi:nicotinamidase/pyrazinamidase